MKFNQRTALRIYALIVTVGAWTASLGAELPHSGSTALSAPAATGEVKIRIRTESDRQLHQQSRIASVEITVAGTSLFVPRSAFADLADPRQAEVTVKRSSGTLIVRGGDGADAYVAKIFFDKEKVNRRTLSSAMLDGKVSEETRYRLRTLKDE